MHTHTHPPKASFITFLHPTTPYYLESPNISSSTICFKFSLLFLGHQSNLKILLRKVYVLVKIREVVL